MTISVDKDPDGGLELLGRVVPHLLEVRPLGTRIVGGADRRSDNAPPRGSPPLPVYTLTLGATLLPNALAAATFVGWRYLIDDNGTPAIAEIRPTNDGFPKFSRLSHGQVATGLKIAAEAATAAYGFAKDNYDARILEVPALHSVSLWLHGDQDVFFRYLDDNGQIPENISEDPNYLNEISSKARAKVDEEEPAPRSE